jgi:hypothetical protein
MVCCGTALLFTLRRGVARNKARSLFNHYPGKEKYTGCILKVFTGWGLSLHSKAIRKIHMNMDPQTLLFPFSSCRHMFFMLSHHILTVSLEMS